MSENWKNVAPEIRELFEGMEALWKRVGVGQYKLVGREIVPVEHLLEWAQWMETAERHIAQTDIGEFWVSTVFLGLDSGYGGGSPILFETMVFAPAVEKFLFGTKRMLREALQYQVRYCTYDEAEAGHREMCEEITRLSSLPENVTAIALSQARRRRGD